MRRGAELGEVGQHVKVGPDARHGRFASRLGDVTVGGAVDIRRQRRRRDDVRRRRRRRRHRHRRQVEVDGEVRPGVVLALDGLKVERHLEMKKEFNTVAKFPNLLNTS